MRLKSTNISLKIRKSERDNERRAAAAAEMSISYRRGSRAARRCHRPADPAAPTTDAGISPCKNHGISAKIISINTH